MSSQLNLTRALTPLVGVGIYLFLWFTVPERLRLVVLLIGGAIVLSLSLVSLFGLVGPTDAAFPSALTVLAATVATGGVLATLPPSVSDPPLPIVGPSTPPPPPSVQGCSPSQPKGPLVQYARGLRYDRDPNHHPRRWDSRRLNVPGPGGGTQPGPRGAIFPQENAHNNTPGDLQNGRVVAEVHVAGNAGYPHLNLPPGKSWIMICTDSEEPSGYIALIIPEREDQNPRTRPVTVFTSGAPEAAAIAQFNEGEPPPSGDPEPAGTVTAAGALDDACVTCKITGWCRL